MSLNRYTLIGKDHVKCFLSLAQVKVSAYMGTVFCVSAALSLVSYFQESFFNNDLYASSLKYKGDFANAYYWSYYYHRDYMRRSMNYKIEELPILLSFTLLHDMFSYLLYCAFSLALDALTIAKLKSKFVDKANMMGAAVAASTISSLNQAELDEMHRSEVKGIAMVVLNSFANFVLRLPELISFSFFLVFVKQKYTFKRVCYDFQQCLSFAELEKHC
jgi:hypothetical protein